MRHSLKIFDELNGKAQPQAAQPQIRNQCGGGAENFGRQKNRFEIEVGGSQRCPQHSNQSGMQKGFEDGMKHSSDKVTGVLTKIQEPEAMDKYQKLIKDCGDIVGVGGTQYFFCFEFPVKAF